MGMGMPRKAKKTLIAVGVVVATVCAIYLGGSLIGVGVANNMLASNRGSEPTQPTFPQYRIQHTSLDFPLMQQRETVSFVSGDVSLKGYLYKVDAPHGLVVAVHGFRGSANDDNSQYQNYFLERGWNVFSFDLRGHGSSGGNGLNSLYEPVRNTKDALAYIAARNDLSGLPICMVGYSCGGYAAVMASGESESIKAVAAFSAYNCSGDIYFTAAENYVHMPLWGFKPGLDFALRALVTVLSTRRKR